MEWKIGEIRQINGEWYQCIEGNCAYCSIRDEACEQRIINDVCKLNRIFKKLEKVGEPYQYMDGIYQQYRVYSNPYFLDVWHTPTTNGFAVKIKQNEEDMEENKTPLPKEDNALTRTVYAYVNGEISDKELIRSIKEMSDEYPYDKNGLKPFSLELAKQGKPVCTRDGRKARIICFDKKGDFPIVALTDDRNYKEEGVNLYDINGKGSNRCFNLMMLPEKKEGWIIVSKNATIYDSLEDAKKSFDSDKELCICKAEWEE